MIAADALVRAACGSRFTAAVLRVERRGALVFEQAYGTVDDDPAAARIDACTRFDLASLTKLATATATLRAVADGALALDAPLGATRLPEWRTGPYAAVTPRDLLAHASGMDSGADYRTLLDADVERFALERAPLAPRRARTIYSDLGFIALGVALARVRGRALRVVLRESACAVGAATLDVTPALRDRSAVPATERDGWRGRVRGMVHDEKAHLLGGIAGHAGLFGTARDVARLAEPYLAAANGRPQTALPPELAQDAVREQAPHETLRRGLGWALKTRDDNSCGVIAARESFGHTGFVGTVLWADPTRDASVALLTNAVYFGRGRDLRDLRAAVCDAAFTALDRART